MSILFRICRPSLVLATLLVSSLGMLPAQADQTTIVAPEAARARELVHMVRQDCGSCHGLQFHGGLGPALTPEVLADKAFDSLVATVVSGRPGTPMPPFLGILSESEAAWIVAQLMKGFPADAGLPPAP